MDRDVGPPRTLCFSWGSGHADHVSKTTLSKIRCINYCSTHYNIFYCEDWLLGKQNRDLPYYACDYLLGGGIFRIDIPLEHRRVSSFIKYLETNPTVILDDIIDRLHILMGERDCAPHAGTLQERWLRPIELRKYQSLLSQHTRLRPENRMEIPEWRATTKEYEDHISKLSTPLKI